MIALKSLGKSLKNRSGSFKEKLLPLEALATEALILGPKFTLLKEYQLKKLINDAETVAFYLLIYQCQRINHNGFQGKILKQTTHSKSLSEYDSTLTNLLPTTFVQKYAEYSLSEIFQLNFKGLPRRMNQAMIHWLLEKWPLVLYYTIPTPKELLTLQLQSKRCVTLITDEKRISKYILNKRDALSFCIHDLEHAVNFYQNQKVYLGQMGFYQFLTALFEIPEIIKCYEQDEIFQHELDYVIADMNAYSVHLLKYTKGILKMGLQRSHYSDADFEHFVANIWCPKLQEMFFMPESLYQHLLITNTRELSYDEDNDLNLWFQSLGNNVTSVHSF